MTDAEDVHGHGRCCYDLGHRDGLADLRVLAAAVRAEAYRHAARLVAEHGHAAVAMLQRAAEGVSR